MNIIESTDCSDITVTNLDRRETWFPMIYKVGARARCPRPPLPRHYIIRLASDTPPRPGFLTADHRFTVQGDYTNIGAGRFQSGEMEYDDLNSEPEQGAYEFKVPAFDTIVATALIVTKITDLNRPTWDIQNTIARVPHTLPQKYVIRFTTTKYPSPTGFLGAHDRYTIEAGTNVGVFRSGQMQIDRNTSDPSNGVYVFSFPAEL